MRCQRPAPVCFLFPLNTARPDPAPGRTPPGKPHNLPAATLTAATAADEPLLLPRKCSVSAEAASPARLHFRVNRCSSHKELGIVLVSEGSVGVAAKEILGVARAWVRAGGLEYVVKEARVSALFFEVQA